MAPRIIETFLESYNLEGTTIIPFCTSGSSDITASEDELKAISPTAHWIDGKRFETNATPDDIRAWIESLH
ncbi:MAG: flavodoxin [Eggerthellaceae bacterium]